VRGFGGTLRQSRLDRADHAQPEKGRAVSAAFFIWRECNFHGPHPGEPDRTKLD